MFLFLQGAHYDLAVSSENMREKYTTKEDSDGYGAEDKDGTEQDNEEQTNDETKTTEAKLKVMEEKYAELKQNYVNSLKEIKTLKEKLKQKENGTENGLEGSEKVSDTFDEEKTLLILNQKVSNKHVPKVHLNLSSNAPSASLHS